MSLTQLQAPNWGRIHPYTFLTGTDENLDCYGNGRFEPKIVITSYLNDF